MGIVAIVFGALFALLFVLTGAGVCTPTQSLLPPLSAAFGYFAGNSLLMGASFLSTMFGLHLIAKKETASVDHPYQELAMVFASGLAALFLLFVFVGGLANYRLQTLTTLFAGSVLNVLLALYFGINLARQEQRVDWLYWTAVGTTAASCMGIGAVLVFMGGV